ncbi:hypothetical protein INS49_008989 [Diaporthe citri]|uniref:uncharacterized protein n=1 Tax=Diaporthe citri TaxID=83186 RepID=UPI001C7F76A4|nr:uncharacterized protein INS49_008989 [Diaporthe citri]KAG6363886.1 hypothetical protein INS49_008989 [Diaporthe citri]
MELAQGACPLCWEYEIVSSHQYEAHVGNHLEQLALFVLPGAEEAEKEEDSESEYQQSKNEKQVSGKDQMKPDQGYGYRENVDEEEEQDGSESGYYQREDEIQLTKDAQRRRAENWKKKGKQSMGDQKAEEEVDLEHDGPSPSDLEMEDSEASKATLRARNAASIVEQLTELDMQKFLEKRKAREEDKL